MVVLVAKAKHDHLQKLASTRDYVKALAEFVWNGLDADARRVSVTFSENALGGVEEIIIADNGTGISRARAEHDFESVGESWKLKTHRTPILGRAIHGKEGKGRLRFFSLSNRATWNSVYREAEKTFRIKIEIDAAALQKSVVSDAEWVTDAMVETGTTVVLDQLKDTFHWLTTDRAFTEFNSLFAPYVMQYPDTTIIYNGHRVDPDTTIDRSVSLATKPILSEGRVIKDLSLRVIEWREKVGSRKMYFGGESGVVLGALSANVTAPGFDFSVYVYSSFFQELADANLLEIDDLTDPVFTAVLNFVREEVGDYFRARQAEKSNELIDDLKRAGIYPYEGDPKDAVERRARQVFDIATHAVSSYSSEFKRADDSLKRITLGLLKEALKYNPDSISRILKAVFNLPKNRQDEFSNLLDKTELGNIIAASSLIADRIVALKVLKQIVFEPSHRSTIKERGELDILVRDNTWIFGENFHFTMPEAGLTKVMNRVSEELGSKARLTKARKADGKAGRVDAFMGRVVPTADRSHREFLLIELKRPSLTIGRKQLDQLEDYVNAIVSQPDYVNTSTSWHFYLVTTEYDEAVRGRVTQKDRAVGLFLDGQHHKVWVKSWAELVREADSRLDFIQEKLQIDVSADEIERRIAELKSSILKTDRIRAKGIGASASSASPELPKHSDNQAGAP